MDEKITFGDVYFAIPIFYALVRYLYFYQRKFLKSIRFYLSLPGLGFYILIFLSVSRGMFSTVEIMFDEVGVSIKMGLRLIILFVYLVINYFIDMLAERTYIKGIDERSKLARVLFSCLFTPAISAFVVLLLMFIIYFTWYFLRM